MTNTTAPVHPAKLLLVGFFFGINQTMGQHIKQISNPVNICAAARQRAEQSLSDSNIKLTRLERAYAVALRQRKDADIKLC